MKRYVPVALAALFSAAIPLFPQAGAETQAAKPWPSSFEGRSLVRIAPGLGDAALARDFPGHVARFSDGRRQIVLRQVGRATRMLHPPRDCFAAMSYVIKPLPMRNIGGSSASCFEARHGGITLRVCEQVRDADGRTFPDVPSWYWPAVLGTSRGPWLATMTVERTD